MIAIDQLEELFDPKLGVVRSAFLEMLSQVHREATAADDGMASEVALVATVRSEYLDALCSDRGMQALRVKPMPLLPISRAGLREAIRRPALSYAGVEVTAELIDTIIEDAGNNLALPLVAFTLEQLWVTAPGMRTLAVEDYRRIGGVRGSVAEVVGRLLDGFKDQKLPEDWLRSAFLMMVRVDGSGEGDGGAPTGYARRRADWRLIPEPAKPILRAFVNKRLLVIGQDAEGATTVEVAHEALFSAWKQLQGWIDGARAELKTYHQLEEDVRDWQASSRGQAELAGRSEEGALERWQRQRLLAGIRTADEFGAGPGIREFIEHAWKAECERLSQERERIKDRRERLHYEQELVEFDDGLSEAERSGAYYRIDRDLERLREQESALTSREAALQEQRAVFVRWHGEQARARHEGADQKGSQRGAC